MLTYTIDFCENVYYFTKEKKKTVSEKIAISISVHLRAVQFYCLITLWFHP